MGSLQMIHWHCRLLVVLSMTQDTGWDCESAPLVRSLNTFNRLRAHAYCGQPATPHLTVVLNLKKRSIPGCRLEDTERAGQAQAGCTFQRPDETGVALPEVILCDPVHHLLPAEKETA